MAEANDIDPIIPDEFDLEFSYPIDESYFKDTYNIIAPTGGANNSTLNFIIPREANRLLDLKNSYFRIVGTIVKTNPAATDLTPNMQIAFANNYFMHQLNSLLLEINGTVTETTSQTPGIYNTIKNLLTKSKLYSASPAALQESGWQIDDHNYFTTSNNNGTVIYCPDILNAGTLYGTISSGMPNSVNSLPFVPAVFSSDTAARGSYATSLSKNQKFSNGFFQRQKLLFNTLQTSVNRATAVPNGLQFALNLTLGHMFLFAETCTKVIKGAQVRIAMQKESLPFRSFVGDSTVLPAVAAETYKNVQTWPPTPGAGLVTAGSGWLYNSAIPPVNFPGPWAVPTAPFTTNYSIVYNVFDLYARIVEPKQTIMADIIEKYNNKPVFYNAKYVSYNQVQVPQSSSASLVLSTDCNRPDWFIFAFQMSGNASVTNAAYTAPDYSTNTPGVYIGASGVSRDQLGFSNYSVFDPLDVKSAQLFYGSRNYPLTNVPNNWAQGDFRYWLKEIEKFRTEYLRINDGSESAPAIDYTNWRTLYPLYLIDMRARNDVITDQPTSQSNNSLRLEFNTTTPNNVTMYYMFLGNAGYEINDTLCKKVY